MKEACEAFATLAASVGVAKSKTIVRDIFPTLLEARGASNKVSTLGGFSFALLDSAHSPICLQVNTGAVDQCIERIIRTTPSRHILGPVLQSLSGSK